MILLKAYFIATEHNAFIIYIYFLWGKPQSKKEIFANLCIPEILWYADSTMDSTFTSIKKFELYNCLVRVGILISFCKWRWYPSVMQQHHSVNSRKDFRFTVLCSCSCWTFAPLGIKRHLRLQTKFGMQG